MLVFEKYDGSNVGIVKLSGAIHAVVRAGYSADSSRHQQHHRFAQWVRANAGILSQMLKDGERFAGEWLAQVHSIKYDLEGRSPLVLFDKFTAQNKRALFSDWMHDAEQLLAAPRLIHIGHPIKPGYLLERLSAPFRVPRSTSAAPEGMVYRVERGGQVDFLAKWVRPDFEPGVYCIGKSEDELMWNTPNWQRL